MNRSIKILSTVAVAGLLAIGTAIPAQATDTTEVVWLLPETVTELPSGNTPAIWPQQYLPDGVVPCDRFGQADVYPTSEVPALIEDGVLDEGEDYKVVISWRFVAGPECEVVVPPVVEPPVVEPPVVVPPVVEPPVIEPPVIEPPVVEPPVVEPPVEVPVVEIPVEVPVVETPELAHTGVNELTGPLGLGALILLAAGVGALFIGRRWTA